MRPFISSKQHLSKIVQLSIIESKTKRSHDRLAVIIDKRITLINTADISHFESDSNYTKLWLTSGVKILSCKTLKRFEDRIDDKQFLRIHNSFIVNADHISHFDPSDNTLVMHSGNIIPVSRARKHLLIQFLKSLMA